MRSRSVLASILGLSLLLLALSFAGDNASVHTLARNGGVIGVISFVALCLGALRRPFIWPVIRDRLRTPEELAARDSLFEALREMELPTNEPGHVDQYPAADQ